VASTRKDTRILLLQQHFMTFELDCVAYTALYITHVTVIERSQTTFCTVTGGGRRYRYHQVGIRLGRHLTGANISDSTCKKFTKYILIAGACLKAAFKCGIGAYAYMSTLADASNNIALLPTLFADCRSRRCISAFCNELVTYLGKRDYPSGEGGQH